MNKTKDVDGASLDPVVRAQEACGGRCGVAECTLDTEGRPMREQRWDIDPVTGEPREWRLIAKEEITGSEWAFPKGKRLRGFKDYRDGDWCVYAPGQYMESRLFGVPETLLEIVRPVNRPNVPDQR